VEEAEGAVRGLGLPVPGPVIGLALLAALLAAAEARGRVSPETVEATDLGRAAAGLLSVLGILFVPAGVGVLQHLDVVGSHGAALLAVLALSTAVTLVATVATFRWVARRTEREG
jgi:putative effector of murein hydrolase LrgA (UPF0299 family)